MLSERLRPNTTHRFRDDPKTIPAVRVNGHDEKENNMTDTVQSQIEADLAALSQVLPDPFHFQSKLDDFFNHPAAVKLTSEGAASVEHLVEFLRARHAPSQVKAAVILLSRFPPIMFYGDLINVLGKADEEETRAFDPGLWMIKLSEEQIAKDLVRIVDGSVNPFPLLLMQRDAAKTVKAKLSQFISERRQPLSLLALYAFAYAMDSADNSLLDDVTRLDQSPKMRALAGLYLLRLGSAGGIAGIRAGLEASEEQLREDTYRELAEHLPPALIKSAGYRPNQKPDTQGLAIDTLLGALGGQE
jgi:hypothetical protein